MVNADHAGRGVSMLGGGVQQVLFTAMNVSMSPANIGVDGFWGDSEALFQRSTPGVLLNRAQKAD